MAVVPAYLNDIFISYVCDDNTATDGLVDAFQEELFQQVSGFGLKKYAPEIFFDKRDALHGSDVNRQFVSQARLSAVFIAFWSPLYFDSKTCCAEWRAFVQAARDLNGRLFVAELEKDIRLRSRELGCPQDPLTYPFYWMSDGNSYKMKPGGNNIHQHDVSRLATDMAREAARQLTAMRSQMESASPRVPRVVLSAPQSLEQDADQIATNCCQGGIITLDPTGMQVLRQRQANRPGAPDLAADWVNGADVIADMIDPADPGAQPGLNVPQGKSGIRWLCRDATASADAGILAELRKQSSFFESPISEFVEKLKTEARRAAARTAAAPPPPSSPGPADPALPPHAPPEKRTKVMLISCKDDAPRVRPFREYLKARGCFCDLHVENETPPGADASQQYVPRAYTGHLRDLLSNFKPQGLVIVDGSNPAAWIDSRLRSCIILENEMPEMRCVIVEPRSTEERCVDFPGEYYLDISKTDELTAFLQDLQA